MPRHLTPLGLCCTILFASAGGWARGDELRLCVTDADSGKPVEGATVERWASEWQPRILRLPAKFWFPQKAVTVNAEGGVTLKTAAGDDWYAVKADGYERVKVERAGDKYQIVPRGEEKPRALAVKVGVVLIHLTEPRRRRRAASRSERAGDLLPLRPHSPHRPDHVPVAGYRR